MLVACAYYNCAGRRVHYESPHVMRKHRTVEVPDDIGFDPMEHRAYCSIECKCYDGFPISTNVPNTLHQKLRYVDPRNEF